MSSDGGGVVKKVGGALVNPVAFASNQVVKKIAGRDVVGDTVSKGLENIGVSDASTRGLLTGTLTGDSLSRQAAGQQIEDDRARAERESEEERVGFNDDIFKLAEQFQGNLAREQTQDFDFESLSFVGNDSRQERLKRLVNAFQNRRQEVNNQNFQPGSSQTRLSIAE